MVSDNPVYFFDIGIDGIFIGRIEMTLREDIVPKTVKNFVALCNAPRGNGYKGSIIHQVRPNVFPVFSLTFFYTNKFFSLSS